MAQRLAVFAAELTSLGTSSSAAPYEQQHCLTHAGVDWGVWCSGLSGMSRSHEAQSRDSVAWGAYPAPMAASTVQGRQHRSAVKEVIMQPTITSEVVVAYAQCPRKAYLCCSVQTRVNLMSISKS